MVRGLDRFRTHFEHYNDRYVLIGGTACTLAMQDLGLEFRATKDIDIVLFIETLDSDFTQAFWDFIRLGRYQNHQKSTGKKSFYRFFDPADDSYPYMVELFSRKPDALTIPPKSHLTPIPTQDDISSLSAILMDTDYYSFILKGKRIISGLPVLAAEYMIPLKAKAWLDMVQRRAGGSPADEKDIKKHRNDVFRLYQIIIPENAIILPAQVKSDMKLFLNQVVSEPIDLKSLGIRNVKLLVVLANLKQFYFISDNDGK
jgi:hypothetical protein